ncbi:MAG TPA: LysR substrate-binding domain-containing protein [Hyphomonadaceae bacterium]|jgi:DNA-binding transcriptional LysR family regulator|nr:LysR substrate-binding domain-containing protein [Hyphomonadaceae bacterium]
MNFQQLRYVREAVRSDLNLTEASQALNTSQSGVSKQIRELEIELGIEIFVRRGKRLTGLTRAGEGAVKVIERVLTEAENLKRLASEFSGEDRGRLVIATTHNQARYALPDVVLQFAKEFPNVQLELRQVTPKQAAGSVLRGEADIAIATEALDQYADLLTFPCFSWRHVVIAPQGHPLTKIAAPALADVAEHPIITYSPEFSGRGQIDAAFRKHDLEPDIRLTAMDADIIQFYVQRGGGVGIVSEMAVSNADRDGLVVLNGSRALFEPSVTKVAFQRGALLHAFAYRFVEIFAPHLSSADLRDEALSRLSLREPKAKAGSRTVEVPAFRRQDLAEKVE